MARCRGCGKEIFWGRNDKGESIPLDPRAPVYETKGFDQVNGETVIKVQQAKQHFVSHFATCTKAGQFSRRQTIKQR